MRHVGGDDDAAGVHPGHRDLLDPHLGADQRLRLRGQAGDGDPQPAGRARRHPQRLGQAGDLDPVRAAARGGGHRDLGHGGPERGAVGEGDLDHPGIAAGSRSSSWIHCPTGPVRLPDSHIVRMSPSTAEYGSSPLAHWPGIASIPAADEDAVTFLMPV